MTYVYDEVSSFTMDQFDAILEAMEKAVEECDADIEILEILPVDRGPPTLNKRTRKAYTNDTVKVPPFWAV